MKAITLIAIASVDPQIGEHISLAHALDSAGIGFEMRERTEVKGRVLHHRFEFLVSQQDAETAVSIAEKIAIADSHAMPSFCPKCDSEKINTRIRPLDDPKFYRMGISYLGPDLERIGYIMAHSLLGDMPILHSSKGFIEAFAILYKRNTTR